MIAVYYMVLSPKRGLADTETDRVLIVLSFQASLRARKYLLGENDRA